MPKKLEEVELFAYLGEDEFGSGEIGLKQGRVPAGIIALVSTHQGKLIHRDVVEQLQRQADIYGKTIHLCRFVLKEEVLTINPREK